MGHDERKIPPSFPPSQARPRPRTHDAKPVKRRTARQQPQPENSVAHTPRPTRRQVRRDSASDTDRRQTRHKPPGHNVLPVGDPRERRRQQPPTPSSERPASFAPARRRQQPDPPRKRRQPPPSYTPQSSRRIEQRPSLSQPAPRPSDRPAQSGSTGALSHGPRRGGPSSSARRRKSLWRPIVTALVLILIAVIVWPFGVLWWASGKITHVDALSSSAATPGVTYLLAGSDERDGSSAVEGRRSDTIMLLHKASNGKASLVSLPRDAYVDLPGKGKSKLNASYAWGGEKLLVQTVEQLSGLHIDHYIEIGMGGFKDIVDAVGGVTLCLDYEVDDPNSGLYWPGGCHLADGTRALAFSRMRYQDPLGDIGRADRQRQVVSAVLDKAFSSDTVWSPRRQVELSGAGARAVQTDPDTSAFDLGRVGLAVRKATKDGLTGAPPISTMALPTPAGVAVELDPELIDTFFEKMTNGTIAPEDFNRIR